MENMITVTIPANPQAMLSLSAQLAQWAGNTVTSATAPVNAAPTEKEMKKAAKAAAKLAKATEVEADEEEFSMDDAEGETEAEEIEEEIEEEEEEEEEEAPKTSITEVQAALVKCVKKHDRAQAAKILKKFGVASVKDLKQTDYDAVIKLALK